MGIYVGCLRYARAEPTLRMCVRTCLKAVTGDIARGCSGTWPLAEYVIAVVIAENVSYREAVIAD